MTLGSTNWWECDGCGAIAELGFVTPRGWQSISGVDNPRHACSRKCARRILRIDMRETLDRWYPKKEIA